jgi:hypothetical protein
VALTIGTGITIGGGITFAPTRSIVTNGLILNVDAGNPASYPGTGTTWYDISGAGNNTTLVGSPPWTDAGNQSYFTFNPGAGYADGGYILPNTTYTKVVVFRVPGAFNNLLGGDGSNQHTFWGASSQYLNAGHNGAWSTITSPVITPVNQWVFGAVSFSNITGWRLYLNNETPVTNPSTTQFAPNPAFIEIGGFDGNANNLGGDIVSALIYNRVLSDEEIAQDFSYYQSRFGI